MILMKRFNWRALLIIGGFIIFCISALILAILSIYVWFTEWDIVSHNFGYIVYMWNRFTLYRICIISGAISGCCFYFGARYYK